MVILKYFFRARYRYKKQKNAKKHFNNSYHQGFFCHLNKDYTAFNKTKSGAYSESSWWYKLKSFFYLRQKTIHLMKAPSRASQKRAWTDPSYSCNKPIFGKYDISFLKHFKVLICLWALGIGVTAWFLWESTYAFDFFKA